jgi:hypothetical protein
VHYLGVTPRPTAISGVYTLDKRSFRLDIYFGLLEQMEKTMFDTTDEPHEDLPASCAVVAALSGHEFSNTGAILPSGAGRQNPKAIRVS